MPELIWVKSASAEGRVGLYESHPAHPGGEAFVAAAPVQVALTPLVERKLAAGELVQVDAPKPVEPEAPIHLTREEVQAKIAALGGTPQPIKAEGTPASERAKPKPKTSKAKPKGGA